MTPDYTINDAFHDGFECGLLYALRYAKDATGQHISEEDLDKLAVHLDSKKCWKAYEEWRCWLNQNISR